MGRNINMPIGYGYDHMHIMRTREEHGILEACKRVSELCGIDYETIYERALTIYQRANSTGIDVPGYMYVALLSAFLASGYESITSYINHMNYLYEVSFRNGQYGDGGCRMMTAWEVMEKMRRHNLGRGDIKIIRVVRHPRAIRVNMRKLRRFAAMLGVKPECNVRALISNFNISPNIKSLAMRLARIAIMSGITMDFSRPKAIAMASIAAAYEIVTGRKVRMRRNVRKIYKEIMRLYNRYHNELLNTNSI